MWTDIFSKASGAKVNKDKTEIMYINWETEKPNLGLKETKERIKILGIEIGQKMVKTNWEKRLPAITGKLLKWEERDLTFTGKVLVLKTEILAPLTSLATVLPANRACIASLRKSIFRFMWSSKQEYIKREVMYRPVEKGGKGVPDPETKLNALFLAPFLNVLTGKKNVLWSYFAKFWLDFPVQRVIGGRVPLNCPHAETLPKIHEKALLLIKKTEKGNQ